jgi:hypothetical protein
MVCVRVPLLLKRNFWVLFGVLRCPRSTAPLFSFLWICNYIMGIMYKPHYASVTPNLFEIYLMRFYMYCCYVWLFPFCCVLRHCFVVCCVAYLYPCSL